MKKLIIILIVGYGVFAWYQNSVAPEGSYGEPHNQLIMYSLTTCGFCKQKAKELRKENIPCTECFIDRDKNRNDELTEKLKKAGFQPRSYGTPIFDAYGVMLPNNPDLGKIKDLRNNI